MDATRMIGRSERLRAYEDAITSRRLSLAEAERRLADLDAERVTLREWIVQLRKEVRSLEREHAQLGRAVTRPPLADGRVMTRPPEGRTMTRPPVPANGSRPAPAARSADAKSKRRDRKTRSP